jgi:hypothetical protein
LRSEQPRVTTKVSLAKCRYAVESHATRGPCHHRPLSYDILLVAASTQ